MVLAARDGGVGAGGTDRMKYNPEIHHRRSIRLRDYDYAVAGAYFVTVCVPGRESLFGEVVDGMMHSNEAGRMIKGGWYEVRERFPNVAIDEFVVMPNHFHGIVIITDNVGAGFPRPDSDCLETSTQGGGTPPLRRATLGQIMGYFKYQTTKQINILRDNPGVPIWQRNYYERIIRDDAELQRTREYNCGKPAEMGAGRGKSGKCGVMPALRLFLLRVCDMFLR